MLGRNPSEKRGSIEERRKNILVAEKSIKEKVNAYLHYLKEEILKNHGELIWERVNNQQEPFTKVEPHEKLFPVHILFIAVAAKTNPDPKDIIKYPENLDKLLNKLVVTEALANSLGFSLQTSMNETPALKDKMEDLLKAASRLNKVKMILNSQLLKIDQPVSKQILAEKRTQSLFQSKGAALVSEIEALFKGVEKDIKTNEDVLALANLNDIGDLNLLPMSKKITFEF